MAYSLLFGERPREAATSSHPFRAIADWIAGLRAGHARRAALANLLELDRQLLDDLGIDRHDVIEALRHPHDAGRVLAARRATSASDWLSHP